MSQRKVVRVSFAEQVDMGGLPVRQPLPTSNLDQIDPFLLLHHARVKVPKHRDPKHAGVGPHPHRGFSPVTFVFEGGVHHRDSRGNSSVIYEGGTQWMHAGMGIIHSERPPQDIYEHGGYQEIIQLWINSPIRNKMDPPTYHGLTADETPAIVQSDDVDIRLVSGRYREVNGPIPSLSDLLAMRGQIKQGGTHTFQIPASHNAFVYLLSGVVRVEGYGLVEEQNLIQFSRNEGDIDLEAIENCRFILMSGEPLNEPVESYGPFVMSNSTEIMEAMRDYQMGRMGVLIED